MIIKTRAFSRLAFFIWIGGSSVFSEQGFVNPDGSPLRKQGEPLRAEDNECRCDACSFATCALIHDDRWLVAQATRSFAKANG